MLAGETWGTTGPRRDTELGEEQTAADQLNTVRHWDTDQQLGEEQISSIR